MLTTNALQSGHFRKADQSLAFERSRSPVGLRRLRRWPRQNRKKAYAATSINVNAITVIRTPEKSHAAGRLSKRVSEAPVLPVSGGPELSSGVFGLSLGIRNESGGCWLKTAVSTPSELQICSLRSKGSLGSLRRTASGSSERTSSTSSGRKG